MLNQSIIFFGKLASETLRRLNLGHGSTWPGHIALKLNKRFISDILKNSPTKIIFIVGTNGKTTSSLMLRTVLEADGKKVLHNESGANLVNGIASTLLLQSTMNGKIEADYAIFEVDENALPRILKDVTPSYLLMLNLFRDQLDRYGEVATIAEKWEKAFRTLPDTSLLITNADDPRTAYLGMMRPHTIFFGLPKSQGKKAEHQEASDSAYCPRCHYKLSYHYQLYSHLGDWYCMQCGLKRPEVNISENIKLSLSGIYNLSNAHGIITLAHKLGTQQEVIANSLQTIKPAFGRQEMIIVGEKQTQLFLAKNPTGFTESLRTIADLKGKHILFLLNDNAADGTDVSWIWDIDLETYLPGFTHLTISGTRGYDMGLRVKYADYESKYENNTKIECNPEKAIDYALAQIPKSETLYILPTYTAMLEVRKILTGRKIL